MAYTGLTRTDLTTGAMITGGFPRVTSVHRPRSVATDRDRLTSGPGSAVLADLPTGRRVLAA